MVVVIKNKQVYTQSFVRSYFEQLAPSSEAKLDQDLQFGSWPWLLYM